MREILFAEKDTCRVCGHELIPTLSLASIYVSDFLSENERANEKYPLDLVLCEQSSGGCGLLQLKHTVSPEKLYRNYWYKSGVNKTMILELEEIAATAESLSKPKPGDFIIDIGANDGTLLRGYSSRDVHFVGFEPAVNLVEDAKIGGAEIINNFFNYEDWFRRYGEKKAKIITAIAMFYDLDEPNIFVRDIKKVLDEDGVFIIQMSYLPLMLEKNAFDNICHEHIEYYSLLSLENLLQRHSLEVFDVVINDVNGGSFRIYIKHKNLGNNIQVRDGSQERILSMREKEKKLGLDKKAAYHDFADRVNKIKDKINSFVQNEVLAGKTFFVYGASTKGNTLLQFCGLDRNVIEFAADRNPDKWGKRTVGTEIPIISEKEARSKNPDYFLVLPWHFLKEFKEREMNYFLAGGKFLMPLPDPRIIFFDKDKNSFSEVLL